MNMLVAIIIVIVLIVGFIMLWKVNHSTPIPKEAFGSIPKCNGCANKSCSNNDSKN